MKDFSNFKGFVDSEVMDMVINDVVKAGITFNASNIPEFVSQIQTLSFAYTMKILEEYHKWLHFEKQDEDS